MTSNTTPSPEGSANFLQVGDTVACGHCQPDKFQAIETCDCRCHRLELGSMSNPHDATPTGTPADFLNTPKENMKTIKQLVDEKVKELYNVYFHSVGNEIHFSMPDDGKSILDEIHEALTEIAKETADRFMLEEKKTIENMIQDDVLFEERGMDGIKGYNTAVAEIKKKRESLGL